MIESRVVLPAPFGPMIATISPGAADSDTPRSASRSPKRLMTPRASRSAPLATEVFVTREPQAERGEHLDRTFDVVELDRLDRRVHVAERNRDEPAGHARARKVDRVGVGARALAGDAHRVGDVLGL